MKVTLFTCGRCRKRYTNPLTHVCITRLDAKRAPGKTRVKPKAAFTCGRCGKPYGNPLTHTCKVKTDYRKRRAAQDRRQKTTSKAKTSSGGRSRPGGGDKHDYRECFHDSQPDRGRAAHDCDRYPCRVYTEGHEHGYHDGHDAGYAEGRAAARAEQRR